MLRNVNAISPKPVELALPLPGEREAAQETIPATLLQELWRTAEAESCGLDLVDFHTVLALVGQRVNHGLPSSLVPSSAQKSSFFRSLHLNDLALAHACALGRESAWEIFLARFQASLLHAAIAITGSATLGHDLADSLYAELYGLRQSAGERRSPLASYSGRGSLLGWLRATLVQRFRDHHRRTHRESPLDDLDCIAAEFAAPIPVELALLTAAVATTLQTLSAEDRFLLSAYYLDRQTLLQIAHTLAVHEATVSRRLKRLTANLHQQLLRNLISSGLSPAAAKEALGADPRDIEINLRKLLQTSQTPAFSVQRANAAGEIR
ncbi:MAG: sigma-70 family RNA polymerase sigma factor [Terracidiphilus sp.]